MAPTADPLLLLRSITTTITTVPETALPAHIPSIASLLYASPILDAAIAISTDASQRSRQEDAAVLVNKFKTRVASLIQSKVSQARWSGAVLAKVAVESSFEALAAYGAVWVKLIANLVTVRSHSDGRL